MHLSASVVGAVMAGLGALALMFEHELVGIERVEFGESYLFLFFLIRLGL